VKTTVKGRIAGTFVEQGFSVGVVGAGYVGLATGACLAYIGYSVTFGDVIEGRIAQLKLGEVPIYEPGLEVLMGQSADRLCFSTELASVVHEADVVFVAANTPPENNGTADLTHVAAVARGVVRGSRKGGEHISSLWSIRAPCRWGAGTTSRC
jgi:UDPglucose 6-dehydrogenase